MEGLWSEYVCLPKCRERARRIHIYDTRLTKHTELPRSLHMHLTQLVERPAHMLHQLRPIRVSVIPNKRLPVFGRPVRVLSVVLYIT